jgi:hypothetical protein
LLLDFLRVFDVVIAKHIGPEGSYLMCIVDLHHVELLNNLLINLDFSGFERRNDFFAEVNSDDIMKLIQGLDFLISRLYFVYHSVCIGPHEHLLHS